MSRWFANQNSQKTYLICRSIMRVFFCFMNRMSKQYGEWFYYDGANVFFGDPGKNDAEKLVYDVDLEEVRLVASLIPGKFDKFDYVAKENKSYSASAPDSVDGMDDFLTQAQKRSDQYYTPSTLLSANPHITNKTELETQLKVAKTMATSQMINIKGISKTCRVKIGNVIDVSFPDAMKASPLGKFRITEIVHEVYRDDNYSNSFLGIAAGMEYIPVPDLPMPLAMPELATVISNKDDEKQGRVKVRFAWQQEGKTTNWIRVQTPDAGVSDKVPKNRGFVFIPEENDQVMVSYLHGNPDRPFVSGNMFHSESGKGGDTDNKTKSITTRSGCTFTIDDEKGSVTIHDKDGIESKMEMNGEGDITISSQKSITLQCGGTSITMKSESNTIDICADDITVTAKNTITSKAENITEDAGNAMLVKGKTSATVSSDNAATVSGQASTTITAVGKTIVEGAIVQFN